MARTFQVLFALCVLFGTGTLNAQSLKKFKSTDIGNPDLKGEVRFLETGVDIKAGGEDIWGNSDQFYFAYQQYKGDFDIAVRLESLEQSHLYAKAGLMVREELTPGSRNLMFVAFPGNAPRNNNLGGYEFQYRLEAGKQSKAIYPSLTDKVVQASFPVNFPNGWMRLKRTGNLFSAYTSMDGETWKMYTEFTMKMPRNIYAGMAVTAHIKGATTVARFRDFNDKPTSSNKAH